MIYIASPYTHPDPSIVLSRYDETQHYCAKLFQQEHWAFSPVVHCHALAVEFKLPTDAEYWKEYNLHMLTRADELHVLQLAGWRASQGVFNEVFFWKAIKHEATIKAIQPTSRNDLFYMAGDFLDLMRTNNDTRSDT